MAKIGFFKLLKTRDGRAAMQNLLGFVENKGERKKAYDSYLYLVMNSVGADRGAMWLYDSFGGSRLNCIVERGNMNYPVRTVLLGEGVPGIVTETGKAALSSDGKRLTVPIMAQNAVFGVIDLMSAGSGVFQKRDEDLTLSIATALCETIVAHSETLILGYHSLNNPQNSAYAYGSSAVIETLASIIEARSGEVGAHSKRIRFFTRLVLSEISQRDPSYGLTKERIELIADAATMHDIGKISIPDAILLKPGRLTPEEYEIIKRHSVIGEELVSKLQGSVSTEYLRYACDICRYHHERWDGNGYPDKLAGKDIPVWAQVVGLIDAYDALTSQRTYKPALSHEEAVQMICEGQCGTFSQEVLESFKTVGPNIKEMAAVLSD